MAYSLGHIVSDAWEREILEREDPFRSMLLVNLLSPQDKQWTHQQYLDRPIINVLGNVVPRIVTVRRNLRRLGNIRLDPRRLR